MNNMHRMEGKEAGGRGKGEGGVISLIHIHNCCRGKVVVNMFISRMP